MHHFAFQNAAAMKLLLVGALKDEPSKPFVAKFFEIFFWLRLQSSIGITSSSEVKQVIFFSCCRREVICSAMLNALELVYLQFCTASSEATYHSETVC